jgi:hypothetical protein
VITHEHAVEVDTKLAALWEARQVAATKASSAIASLHSSLGHKYQRAGRGEPPYRESAADTEAEAREVITNPVEGGHWWMWEGKLRPQSSVRYLTQALDELDAAREAARTASREAAPLEAEFDAERWPRFFLVTNTGGHIHRSMNCSTTFPTTQWAWLPSLSGLGEDAAVAQEGPRLCSVCFPSAPVEWTLGLPKKLNPNQCPGSGQPARSVNYRYQTPRGRCAVCGESVAASRSTGSARPHNKPKGA